jgi:hypothetical protein
LHHFGGPPGFVCGGGVFGLAEFPGYLVGGGVAGEVEVGDASALQESAAVFVGDDFVESVSAAVYWGDGFEPEMDL